MNYIMTFPETVEEFMEQHKIVDSDHVYTNGTEFVPVFRMRQWFEHLDAVPKTNADRIRNMTDEELAKWIVHRTEGSGYKGEKEHIKAWLDWLKQEAGT